MNQEKLEKVLLEVGKKLEEQWEIKPEINYQGTIIIRNFASLAMKNMPEEQAKTVNATVIKTIVEAAHATFNNAEWTQVIGPTGHLVITYKVV